MADREEEEQSAEIGEGAEETDREDSPEVVRLFDHDGGMLDVYARIQDFMDRMDPLAVRRSIRANNLSSIRLLRRWQRQLEQLAQLIAGEHNARAQQARERADVEEQERRMEELHSNVSRVSRHIENLNREARQYFERHGQQAQQLPQDRLGNPVGADYDDVSMQLEGVEQFVDDKILTPAAAPAVPTMTSLQYLRRREYGDALGINISQLYRDRVSHQLPGLLRENEYNLGPINKIFAAAWLSDRQVVFGTKCNQLVVMNVQSGQMTTIPTLKSSEESIPAPHPCGIHGISVNPSGTMLATGASNTNDIGIYKLPTFDPFCVGEGAHKDWVFDLEWVDDEFLISGSRDNVIALWRINNVDESETSRMSCLYVPEYAVRKPLATQTCQKAEKVRALSINRGRKEMAVLSLNAMLHLWNIETFQQIWSKTLKCSRENVCMAVSEEKNLYAVGSHSYVTLIDCRKQMTQPIATKQRDRGLFQGIRSLSFKGDIITIGTGTGIIMFYDLRAGKYLESVCGHPCQLAVGQGWLRQDENYRDIFIGANYPNAIYTHTYDETGVRLFAAGGPLPAGLWGNYAAMWA